MAAERKQDYPRRANKIVQGWTVYFSALLEKLQQHGFCALKPDGTNLFNEQDFLKEYWLHSNQVAPGQDLVGSIVGYAVAHDQDGDSDIHKPSVALGIRHASALSRQARRFQMRLFPCDVHREPS